MARQVLPIVGAVVGTFFGQPQLGFAIGSIIGNAVDPLRVRGPSLKELPVMGVTEGAFRQVAYGTTVIRDCQLIDWGDLDPVTVKEQQGKGGGPIGESQRLYQTYAVALGEPVEAIRYIKRNGVMVYDVRPGSTILDESVAFAERFRFYDGSDTQLPDPDLEALPRNGVGNTPAYRGTAYFVMVRDDLTDSRGQIPTYEVEVLRTIDGLVSNVTLATNVGHYSGARDDIEVAAGTIGWQATGVNRVAVSPNGLYAFGSGKGAVSGRKMEIRKFDPGTQTWSSVADPAVMPVIGPSGLYWAPDGNSVLVTGADTVAGDWIVYNRVGDIFTKADDPDFLNTSSTHGTWDYTGARLAVDNANTANVMGIWNFAGGTIGEYLDGLNLGGEQVELSAFRPIAGSRYVAVCTFTFIYVIDASAQPLTVAAVIAGQAGGGLAWSPDGNHIIGVADDVAGPNDISIWAFDDTPGSEALTLVGTAADQTSATPSGFSFSPDRRFLALVPATVGGELPPDIFEISTASPPVVTRLTSPDDMGDVLGAVSWADLPDIPQYDDSAVLLSAIVGDICDRCGIPAGKLDLTQLTDVVKGMTLGGPYDGAGAITTLMPAYLFDLFAADRELIAQKRGAAVKATLTVDDLLEEPDENMLRGQGIEYPRALQLKYLNPGQNYAAPATTVTNKTTSGRVLGEVNVDLPIAFDETEALNVATRMLKVMWEDVNGEAVLSLPAGPFAWLTPTDCLGLVLRGALYRIRVEKIEATAGQLKITARRDRQSAYTSNLTAIPLPPPAPPPPSLAGITTFVPMNIPGRVDEDDRLGFVFGMTGLPGTAWRGANIAYRIAGGTDWTNLGNFTGRSAIGQLTAPLPAASEFYTDTTNTLAVQLIGDDELESVTLGQFLSEGNPAAIIYPDRTAEIVQFKDVDDLGGRLWELNTLLRGRLATVPGPHLAGAFFVPLVGTEFVALPSALIGQTLQFRVTSLGTSPEAAPVYEFVWNPVHSQLELAPLNLVLERTGGNISGTWTERRRFGTEIRPIASVNFEGYRVTLTDGVTSQTFDTTLGQFGTTDAAFSGPITVTVQQLNRFTGAGPGTSEVIA